VPLEQGSESLRRRARLRAVSRENVRLAHGRRYLFGRSEPRRAAASSTAASSIARPPLRKKPLRNGVRGDEEASVALRKERPEPHRSSWQGPYNVQVEVANHEQRPTMETDCGAPAPVETVIETVIETVGPGNTKRDRSHPADESGVGGARDEEALVHNVPFRNDEKVVLRGRVNVCKGEQLTVLVDDSRRQFASEDAAKDGAVALKSRVVACVVRAGAS
jgi:hypothetical protein